MPQFVLRYEGRVLLAVLLLAGWFSLSEAMQWGHPLVIAVLYAPILLAYVAIVGSVWAIQTDHCRWVIENYAIGGKFSLKSLTIPLIAAVGIWYHVQHHAGVPQIVTLMLGFALASFHIAYTYVHFPQRAILSSLRGREGTECEPARGQLRLIEALRWKRFG
jgi:hypothetical protein